MKPRPIPAPDPRPGLPAALAARTRHALDCGALQPIQTKQILLADGPVQFIVRLVSSLARKAKAGPRPSTGLDHASEPRNPFLPYDRDLWVADLSDTHVGLLNKFQVVDHHLLIVTRHFEDQETLLTLADFEALWLCLAEMDGLGFYNGGKAAGASQPHKHLQVVSLPLCPAGPSLPISPLLESAPPPGNIGRITSFPFRHALVRLGQADPRHGPARAKTALGFYHQLLEATGFPAKAGSRQAGPYNLLITRDWMLLVPRSKECFRDISINALGFAGSLFVRNQREMRLVQAQGPWAMLSEVGQACPLTAKSPDRSKPVQAPPSTGPLAPSDKPKAARKPGRH